MKAITFTIKLKEPVLATQTQNGEPDSSVSKNFISGRMLRGALIRKHSGGKHKNLHQDQLFYDLFFSGKVKFLNAYPEQPALKERMLPKPLSWFTPKDELNNPEAEILDFVFTTGEGEISYKPPKVDFFTIVDEKVQLTNPEIETTLHNTSQNRNLVQQGSSQVYRYDALAAGQTFSGVIISEDQELLKNEIQPLLEGEFLLGGAYRAGYGRVSIRDVKHVENWREYRQTKNQGLDSQYATLTCLSDLILYPGSMINLRETMEEATEAPLLDHFYRLELVGGFNRKWGLPMPQNWAIKAGSVFVFPAAAKEKLENLAVSGFGNRLLDGYGRLAVNLNLLPELEQAPMSRRRIDREKITLSPESEELARNLGKRQLRIALDHHIAEKVGKLAYTQGSLQYLPKASQLMRARLAAQKAYQTSSLQPIQEHFEKLTALSKKTWKKALIGNSSLLDWIDTEIKAAKSFTLDKTYQIAGIQAELDERMRCQTIARIIEGVLKQAAKQSKTAVKEGVK